MCTAINKGSAQIEHLISILLSYVLLSCWTSESLWLSCLFTSSRGKPRLMHQNIFRVPSNAAKPYASV